MLNDIKLSLRISHTKLDTEIENNINSCLKDLQRVGVLNRDTQDPLIFKAVELYCKWQFDFLGKAERYEKFYTDLIKSISLCGYYNV